MTAYDDWLVQLAGKLDAIDQGASDLLASVTRLLASATTYDTGSASFAGSAAILFGPGGASYFCLNTTRAAEIDLLDLYADMQAVVEWQWLLGRALINPTKLFDPIEGDYGGGATYALRQDGTLTLQSGDGSPTNQTPIGQAGFLVPIELQFLGNTINTRMHLGVDLAVALSPPQTIQVRLSSPLRVAATVGLAPASRWLIESHGEPTIVAALAGAALELPSISVFPTPARLWTAWQDGAVRIAGSVQRRARHRQGMVALRAGFPVTMRLQLALLTNEIAKAVSSYGATIFSGPTVVGAKRFTLQAGIEERKSIKLGKDLASARVKVWQDFEGSLSVSGRQLHVTVNPVGSPGRDVDIYPKIPPLTNWVEDIIEDFIKRKIPQISGVSEIYYLSGVWSFDVWLSPQFIELGVDPR